MLFNPFLGGGSKYFFMFTLIIGEDSDVDEPYFSGLTPPKTSFFFVGF